MVDGCEKHSVSAVAVESRWESVEALINSTPEDDHDYQWSVICFCACCLGPAKLPHELCSRCEVPA